MLLIVDSKNKIRVKSHTNVGNFKEGTHKISSGETHTHNPNNCSNVPRVFILTAND